MRPPRACYVCREGLVGEEYRYCAGCIEEVRASPLCSLCGKAEIFRKSAVGLHEYGYLCLQCDQMRWFFETDIMKVLHWGRKSYWSHPYTFYRTFANEVYELDIVLVEGLNPHSYPDTNWSWWLLKVDSPLIKGIS